MPLFSDTTENLVINNSRLIDIGVQNNYNLFSPGQTGELRLCCPRFSIKGFSGIDILLQSSIPDAAYNSSARHPPPKCFPGTREQYVEDIIHWADPVTSDSLRLPPMYWMKGPAGVGKSAIAQTCAEKLHESGQLGAAFFFSINGRDDPKCFFASIAYQLSTKISKYRDVLNATIQRDKSLVKASMPWQFRGLLVEPLEQLRQRGEGISTGVIIVDGLDECAGADAQCEIIEIIAASARDKTTPFRWVLFSRPEPYIEGIFSKPKISFLCHRTILPISREADGEIELYLKTGFENILRRQNLLLQSPWPSKEQLRKLVNSAAGHFIYAVTILRFISENSLIVGPQEPLQAVLVAIADSDLNRTATATTRPFVDLDALYMFIMQRIPSEMLFSVQLLVATMLSRSADARWGALVLSNILRLSEAKFRIILSSLHAVLRYSSETEGLEFDDSVDTTRSFQYVDLETVQQLGSRFLDLGGAVSFYHRSFCDFLINPARSFSFSLEAPGVKKEVIKHHLLLSRDYDRYWSGQQHKMDATSARSSDLSWPFTNELVNSLLKATIYRLAFEIVVSPVDSLKGPHPDLWPHYKNLNFYSRALVERYWWRDGGTTRCFHYNCFAEVKRIRNTLLYRISPGAFDEFDTIAFKYRIGWFRQLKLFRPYFPNFTSRLKNLFRTEPRGSVVRGHYVYGNGKRKVFWYWEFSTELQYYQEFRTIDREEGEREYEKQALIWLKESY